MDPIMILTMVDDIYPKLRFLTNGIRTALTIFTNLSEEEDEWESEDDDWDERYGSWRQEGTRTGAWWQEGTRPGKWDEEGARPWARRAEGGYSGHADSKWKGVGKSKIFDLLDSESEDDEQEETGREEEDVVVKETEKMEEKEKNIVPVRPTASAQEINSRLKVGKKSLRSRFASIFRRLTCCIPKKQKI